MILSITNVGFTSRRGYDSLRFPTFALFVFSNFLANLWLNVVYDDADDLPNDSHTHRPHKHSRLDSSTLSDGLNVLFLFSRHCYQHWHAFSSFSGIFLWPDVIFVSCTLVSATHSLTELLLFVHVNLIGRFEPFAATRIARHFRRWLGISERHSCGRERIVPLNRYLCESLAYPGGGGHWAIAQCLKIYCPVIFWDDTNGPVLRNMFN